MKIEWQSTDGFKEIRPFNSGSLPVKFARLLRRTGTYSWCWGKQNGRLEKRALLPTDMVVRSLAKLEEEGASHVAKGAAPSHIADCNHLGSYVP